MNRENNSRHLNDTCDEISGGALGANDIVTNTLTVGSVLGIISHSLVQLKRVLQQNSSKHAGEVGGSSENRQTRCPQHFSPISPSV
jgi:hypothetical protein